jgi:predicted nucleic acid-binding protein
LATGLSALDVEIFLATLVSLAKPVDIHFLWRPQLRDACDEMVLETAVNGKADAIVTFNGRHFGTAPSQFGIEALLPREALKRSKK